MFADVVGHIVPIGVQELTAILRIFKGDIRIVLLNVCYSKSYAEVISQEIDFVIGMDGTIEEAAIIFASYFYQALASGRSVSDQQLEGARLKVKAGALNLEARLQGVSESASHAEVTIKRRQRPKRLADISIEIA